ncbi:MAG: CAP domain-containing protein [Linnemannia elongata]|nr:MAG: CAP domain-containing protein [Linnemannia elongata]
MLKIMPTLLQLGCPCSDHGLCCPTPTVKDRSLELINNIRANYGAMALKWNPLFAMDAVAPTMFYYSVTPTTTSPLVDAVSKWASTSSNYDFGNPGIVKTVASFTQLVWKSSTHVGCAWTTCKIGTIDPTRESTLVVCKFSPGGNTRSKIAAGMPDPFFASNVGNPPVVQNRS